MNGRAVWTIARRELRESLRHKWLWAYVVGFAGLATALSGASLAAAGYAGLGKLMRFVPMPVVTGFTAGIAVIIASSQVGDFLGLSVKNVPAEFIGKWEAYLGALNTT